MADLACAIADGAEVISDFRVMGDQHELFGPVASVPTCWRTLEEIASDGSRVLARMTVAVNVARRRAWAAAVARPDAVSSPAASAPTPAPSSPCSKPKTAGATVCGSPTCLPACVAGAPTPAAITGQRPVTVNHQDQDWQAARSVFVHLDGRPWLKHR